VRCAYCHDDLLGLRWSCPVCGTQLHTDCRAALRRGPCATLGCPGDRPRPAHRARPRQVRARAQAAPTGVVAALGVLTSGASVLSAAATLISGSLHGGARGTLSSITVGLGLLHVFAPVLVLAWRRRREEPFGLESLARTAGGYTLALGAAALVLVACLAPLVCLNPFSALLALPAYALLPTIATALWATWFRPEPRGPQRTSPPPPPASPRLRVRLQPRPERDDAWVPSHVQPLLAALGKLAPRGPSAAAERQDPVLHPGEGASAVGAQPGLHRLAARAVAVEVERAVGADPLVNVERQPLQGREALCLQPG